jgi:hypothetical protein
MRWRRRRRDDPRVRLAQDIRQIAGFMAAVVDQAERLHLEVPDLAAGCVNAWRRWGRYLEKRE